MAKTVDMKNFPMRIDGDIDEDFYLVSAKIHEGMNRVPEITMEFVCPKSDIDLNTLLGKEMRAVLSHVAGFERSFPGTCISAETLGRNGNASHYLVEVRPWLWFLGRTEECRIFQNKTVVEIFDEIMADYGFSGSVHKNLSNTYPTREYTVQYRETDLDFLSRLMEEAGIFYYFMEDRSGKPLMIMADDLGAYIDSRGFLIPFRAAGEAAAGMAHVYEWSAGLGATSGKVTLRDYNFEMPGTLLESSKEMNKGSFPHNNREKYAYPGRYGEASQGDDRAKVRMEAEAVRHNTVVGAGNFMGMRIGRKFGMQDLLREGDNGNDAWLMIAATHRMQQPVEISGQSMEPRGGLGSPQDDDLYRIDFEAIPSDQQYRAPQITPWPRIEGVQTAVVTGAAGEEIDTDEYGRIKVQFHWDRDGNKDENTSCRVRVMTPWAGSKWGMIAIPRIGQEMVVQFLDGDPDRPLAVGMVYNAENMPPYDLPANKTQSGIKTDKSKGGGGFNELRFEDKAGSEEVYFQAERDYNQVVKNNATISVGEGHKDKGDMTLDVHRHLTETVKTGNHTFKVSSGAQTLNIKKDKTETVEGKSKLTVTGDVTEAIKTGNYARTIDKGNEEHTVKMGNLTRSLDMGSETQTLKMGSLARTLDMGNVDHSLKMGNYTVKCDMGKITLEAPLQGIELKCGANTLKVDMMGVTINGMMVKMEGSVMTTVKGTILDVNGSAMTMVKGGVVMVN